MISLHTSASRGAPIRSVQTEAKLTMPSDAFSTESKHIAHAVRRLAAPTPTFSGTASTSKNLDEKLFDTLASLKLFTAQIAMHLDTEWRSRFFRQLDSLLDRNEWDTDDVPPELASYATLLRMLLAISPTVRPGLGATSNGHMIATWTNGDDRLTIECLPGDQVRWSVSILNDGETERAAGVIALRRLEAVIAPYFPERWLKRAQQIHSA